MSFANFIILPLAVNHKIIILLFLFTLGFIHVSGQEFSQERMRKLVITNDSLQLDSLSLIPGSVSVYNHNGKIDSSTYTIDPATAILIFKVIPADTLTVSYRVFPFNFSKRYRNKDYSAVLEKKKISGFDPFKYNPADDRTNADLFGLSGLRKTGSVSRGVSFGNNQDVVVNSSLNLQLSGRIAENLDLLVAATDDNIPIQPEGNTQTLNEFDKVFIQLSNDRSKLVAGDFNVSRPRSYFLNYNKRAQGLYFSTLTARDSIFISGSAAVSKGKFARNLIRGVEGNQGPYRLRGADNEPFIIVLSGSERIFIDGVLMERGQEHDYVIDYNTAEIIFTPRNLITKDKRIVAEFQYSDRNYSRSLVTQETYYSGEKVDLFLNVFSEQDAKNQPLQQDLTDQEKLTLFNVGDNLENAFSSGVDSVEFSSSLVLYRRTDSTVTGGVFPDVYVYSTDPSVAHYQLSFSNVGQGNGNYIQVASSANGRVFKWVEPVNNIKQGLFEPVRVLVTPKKKQMVTAGALFKPAKGTRLLIEGAASNNDINTFSPYNSRDDAGYAFKLDFNNSTFIHDSSKRIEFIKGLVYEYVMMDFSAAERFRAVEFERDWNIQSPVPRSDQHIATALAGIKDKKNNNLNLYSSVFVEGSFYKGLKGRTTGTFQNKSFSVTGDASYLASEASLQKTNFGRARSRITKNIKWLTLGLREEFEDNRFTNTVTDSLLINSYRFLEWEAFAETSDTLNKTIRVFYRQRKDEVARENSYLPLTSARDIGFSGSIRNKNNDLRLTFTHRELGVLQSALTTIKPENTVVGRVDHSLRLWKNALTASTFYEVGSGLELRKEFSYLEVPTGQGVYAWIDYNSNGVKELNEFDIALFPDQAKYVRVFTPTDDYVRAFSNQFVETIMLRPISVWNNKKGIRKALSLFSDQASYRVDRKTTEDDPRSQYDPFYTTTSDTSLLSISSTLRNTLFFNQGGQKFSMEHSFQEMKNKTLLTNGFETRNNTYQEVRARWNISRRYSLNQTYRDGRKVSRSEFFSNRDYNIFYDEAETRISFQSGTSFRITGIYRYVIKKNAEDLGGENSTSNEIGAELRYNVLSKSSLTGKVSFIDIDFSGETNSPVSYELLQGLKPGKNITWNFSLQRTLANNLQLNLNYDGRTSEDSKVIHTGGVQARAFF